MTAEVANSLPTLKEAAGALYEAREAVRRHGQNYARLRNGMDSRATTRARAELGLAVLGYINASVTLAEVKDCVDPVWAAATCGGPMFTGGPGHEQCERAWGVYQKARRTGDHAAIATARDEWRDAQVSWGQQLHERREAEDQEHAENLRRRWDQSERLHPEDAFPQPPNGRREAVVRSSRERERQESIRRANGDFGSPWGPWPRGS